MKVIVKKKIHYSWAIVFFCFLIAGAGVGVLVNSMGTFIKPVSDAMGYTRAQFSSVTSFSCLMTMLSYPFWGTYLKTHSIRKCIIFSSIVLPLIITGYSFCQELYQFYLCGILIGLLTATVSTLPISALIDSWFSSRRGFALGLATCGTGLGAMLMTPAISACITQYGWRIGYRFVAVVFFLAVFPGALFVLSDSPAEKNSFPYGCSEDISTSGVTKDAELHGITRKEALKSPQFICFLAVAICMGCINNGMTNHIYAFLTDIGYPAHIASTIISLQMLMLMVSKFVIGTLMDRFGIKLGGLLSMAAYFITSSFLILAGHYPLLALMYIPAAGIGGAYPAMSTAYITNTIFGNKDYRAIFGIVLSMVFLGNTLGATLAGFIYDFFGGYTIMWIFTLILSLGSMFLYRQVLYMVSKQGIYHHSDQIRQ